MELGGEQSLGEDPGKLGQLLKGSSLGSEHSPTGSEKFQQFNIWNGHPEVSWAEHQPY